MKYDDVKLGSVMFTLVEPHQGYEVEFNRFYERDHFYAGMMIGAYTFAGQRWIATRVLKQLRYPDGPNAIAPSKNKGSYLALYWCLAGHHDEWKRWGTDTWNELNAAGRINVRRDRIHSLYYSFEGAVLQDPHGPAPEQALDHRYPGLAAVVYRSSTPDALAKWLDNEHLPSRIAGTEVGQVLVCRPLQHLQHAPYDITDAEAFADHLMTLWFLNSSAADLWPHIFAGEPALLQASGRGSVEWMSPFLPSVPGTDMYIDQL